jgi:hypothetical protein
MVSRYVWLVGTHGWLVHMVSRYVMVLFRFTPKRLNLSSVLSLAMPSVYNDISTAVCGLFTLHGLIFPIFLFLLLLRFSVSTQAA